MQNDNGNAEVIEWRNTTQFNSISSVNIAVVLWRNAQKWLNSIVKISHEMPSSSGCLFDWLKTSFGGKRYVLTEKQ